ncbi:MAG TPA: DUF167 domain-containing protein [Ornithinibacter sp.]|uniref:DUF167 domain-containing protein n=1 Tax=Ornithinibacter sp. TaxID=2862748 RepID=UPI001B6F0309|nr:DUF167 domain-containing protein [Ornithinibacter sp.]MBP6524593.1 DUF167 domain-containing protein [Dermatophilaceae bacterium]MBU9943921.1 DUF167 domain-containing protein [Dermatophilaceae bacterium]HOT56944.1 DUF167 domain-containing protein [Ornithinibacter sp.]HQV81808.1 DUF167 domain-containing protein [Ornithinibacter sp.]HQW72656.1 DUF167 domain-containing protein [Ornithinibacter sp.]
MHVTVRVRPGASRTRVGGRWGDGEVLGVSVSARAVDGAATAAVCAAVAGAFGVRPREVSLVAGERSRTKVLEVCVDADQGRRTLEALLAR